MLCAILLGAGLGYVALAFDVAKDTALSERRFGEPARDDARQLRVYIEALTVDAVNDTMRLQISFAPNPALRGRRMDGPDRDITVQFGDGDTVQESAFHAHQPMAAAAFDADLHDGTVAAYPLDRFRAGLRLLAQELGGAPVPLQVTVWEGVAGWTLAVAQKPGGEAGGVQLRFGVRRPAALRMLALAIYAEMTLVACTALTIGGLVFLRRKSAESTLTGALGGMLFALPAMRYAMPGAPPLGVRADLLVFLWAELAVALALLLFVVVWAQPAMRK